jgi:hypothetical protein
MSSHEFVDGKGAKAFGLGQTSKKEKTASGKLLVNGMTHDNYCAILI